MGCLVPRVTACPFPHGDHSGTQGLDDCVTAEPTRHTHLKGCCLHPAVTWELHLILAPLSVLRTTPWVTTCILYSRSLFWTQTLSTEGIQKAWVSGNGGPHGRVPTPPAGHEDGAMAGPQGGRQCGRGSSPGTSPGPGCRLAARLAVSRALPLPVAGAKAGSRRPVSAGRAMSDWLTTAPSQLPVAGTPRPDALCVTPWDKPELPAAGLSLPLLAEPFGKAGRSIRVQAWPSASDRVWVDRQRAPCRGAPPAP